MPSRDISRVSRRAEYVSAWREWFQALPESERQRLIDLKIDQPLEEQFGPVIDDDDEENEGLVVTETPWTETDREETRQTAEAFARALAWCCQGETLVAVGNRLLAVLHIWRPVLVAGMVIERELDEAERFERERASELGAPSVSEIGRGLGAALEWMRRGKTIAAIGQRAMAAAYVLAPAAIGGATLAEIGAYSNKTRQAIDKLVQDFRDTFGGLRSRAMRGEEHRRRCRETLREGAK